MKIILTPLSAAAPLSLSKEGDTLTVNGVVLDFSSLPAGATLPRSAFVGSEVAHRYIRSAERSGTGELMVLINLPHGANAPEATRFPAPLENVDDGPVTLPIYDNPPAIEEPEEETPA